MTKQRIYIRGVWEQLYEIEATTPKQAYEEFLEDSSSDKITMIEDKQFFVCDLMDEDILKLKPYRTSK